MFFYSDLHIHSKYSRATSRDCNLEQLSFWAKKKGLSVISTGDFTHPAWFNEITEKLVPAGDGVYRLRPDIENQIFNDGSEPVRFILSVEISTIYKKWDKTRKVHHVCFMPDLQSADRFRQKLGAIGNIVSDGRPILGLDSRSLLETTLESGEGACIIPAHIWTPWFSALGSKSGFDSIEDCYEDLSEHIFAVETGLSSDPEMNWRVSKLDRFRLVSNSDAHSPAKLAREATVFDTEPDYFHIMNALKTGEGYVGTVEFFPEEGKYHEDGHRKCNVCLTPEETKALNGICPVCGKPLTIGVSYRVNELSDRKGEFTPPPTAGEVYSLVPLPEIISEILGVGVGSKSVVTEYERITQKLGSELSILQELPIDDITKVSPLLGEGISRLRQGKVMKHAGYDGEYGVIKLFEQDELVNKKYVNLKLIEMPQTPITEPTKVKFTPAPAVETPKVESSTPPPACHTHVCQPVAALSTMPKKSGLDENQQAAVTNPASQLLIVAGPGSGKTTVLTRRIAHLISNGSLMPENCLAITFTRRAAQEMRERLAKLVDENAKSLNIHTFHSLCFSILKENYAAAGLHPDFTVMSEQEKELCTDTETLERALNFDELITLTVKLLEENPEILQHYNERFTYVSVDEYQDIDAQQYKLIRLLVPENGKICAIGDPNQAIYGFRGGDSKFFGNFAQDYPNAITINLKNNYRSTGNIVNASNQMIQEFNIVSMYDNPHEKQFSAVSSPLNRGPRTAALSNTPLENFAQLTYRENFSGDKITIHTAPTDKAEAEFVASTIERLIGGHSLFSIDSERSSGQECEYSFADFAILYRTSSQLPPLIEALQRTGMPFVTLSNEPLCEKKPILELLKKLNSESEIPEQLAALEEEFSAKIADNIWKFLINLAQTHREKVNFLHEVSLLTEADTLDKRADRITLMTLHSSKGLEFKCVFITGLEDGILPLYRAKEAAELEEERRLLYVGMTRAEERLFLSRATKRRWQGLHREMPISPFLEKIEQDLLNLSKFDKVFKEKDNSQQLSLF